MEIEDDDKKIRRNLVIASSTVLIFAWLDVPFSAVLQKLIPSTTANADPWKFWVIAFFVFTYLGTRYKFSPAGKEYLTSASTSIRTLRHDKGVKFLQLAADRFTQTGVEPRYFKDQLTSLALDVSRPVGKVNADGTWQRPKMYLSTYSHQSQFEFEFSMAYSWSEENGHINASSSGGNIRATIDGLPGFYVNQLAVWHHIIHSESSINHLVPVVLGLAALVSLWLRVIQAYLA